MTTKGIVVRDGTYPEMFRVRWPDGRLSDMTNPTRANDAAACFNATTDRERRGRQSPAERLQARSNENPAPPS